MRWTRSTPEKRNRIKTKKKRKKPKSLPPNNNRNQPFDRWRPPYNTGVGRWCVHRANHQLDFLSHHIYYYIIGDIIVYVHLHSKGYRHAIVNFSKPFSIVYDPPPHPFPQPPSLNLPFTLPDSHRPVSPLPQ